MLDESTLLRQYAESRNEAAFAKIVDRHFDGIYSSALRRVGGDAHLAKDVAQEVFAALARNASKVSSHPVLSAWLYTTTRNISALKVRRERRRKVREKEVTAMHDNSSQEHSATEWHRIGPMLDQLVDDLGEIDRRAVLLRFIEHRSLAEVGTALSLSENAARMRVDRALDKLRAMLRRRGILSTSSALAAVLTEQAVIAAPVGLAAEATSAALASSAAILAPTGAGIGIVTLMTTKTIAIASASALLAFGVGAYFGLSRGFNSPLPTPIESPQQSRLIGSLRHDNLSLKSEVDRLSADIVRLNAAYARQSVEHAASASSAHNEDVVSMSVGQKQIRTLNYLRQIDAARAQYKLDNGKLAASIQDLVGENKYIRRIEPLDGEDYTGLSMVPGQALTVAFPDGTTVTFDPSGTNTTLPQWSPAEKQVMDLATKIEPSVNNAIGAYRAANGGANPPEIGAIIPYFATPQEGADFVEYLEAARAAHMH